MSPILAGTTQLTKNETTTMGMRDAVGRSSPALRRSSFHRHPRTMKVAWYIARAAREYRTLAWRMRDHASAQLIGARHTASATMRAAAISERTLRRLMRRPGGVIPEASSGGSVSVGLSDTGETVPSGHALGGVAVPLGRASAPHPAHQRAALLGRGQLLEVSLPFRQHPGDGVDPVPAAPPRERPAAPMAYLEDALGGAVRDRQRDQVGAAGDDDPPDPAMASQLRAGCDRDRKSTRLNS